MINLKLDNEKKVLFGLEITAVVFVCGLVLGIIAVPGFRIHSLFIVLMVCFFLSIALMILGTLLNRYFYRRFIIKFSEPLNSPIAGFTKSALATTDSINLPTYFKCTLSFKVPFHIRTHKSDEVVVEYFQGVVVKGIEGLQTLLYEKLDVLHKPVPNNIRGLFLGFGYNIKPELEKELSVRVSSSKLSVTPADWIEKEKGTRTPCRWRWGISCDELGIYDIVIELSEGFQKYLSESPYWDNQRKFEVEVRSDLGLTPRAVSIVKASSFVLVRFGALVALIIIALSTLFAGNSTVQNVLTNFIKPILPH